MIDIDRIARQLLDTEPSIDLETRIRARLDAEPATPRRAWRQWAMAGGVAGIAVTAVLLFVVQKPAEPDVEWARSPAILASRNLPAEASTEEGPGVRGSGGPEVRGSRGPEVTVAALSVEELAWMDRRIPLLETVEELRVDFLTYESIQPEGLSIAPLIMTALPSESWEFERYDNR